MPRDRKPEPTLTVSNAFVKAFDYGSLTDDVRGQVEEHARAIHDLQGGMVTAAVEIGRRLCEAREQLGPKLFTVWLAAEFKFSQSVASNWMNAYRRFGTVDVALLEHFDISALAELARDRVAPAAREEAIEMARSGQKVSQLVAVRLGEKHREETPARSTRAATASSPRPSPPSMPAIAGAEASARPRDLTDVKSAVRVALRRRPERFRQAVAAEVVDAVREVLAEFRLEHLLSRPASIPAPAAAARIPMRQVREAGVPVVS